jgi:hypothetical protein
VKAVDQIDGCGSDRSLQRMSRVQLRHGDASLRASAARTESPAREYKHVRLEIATRLKELETLDASLREAAARSEGCWSE